MSNVFVFDACSVIAYLADEDGADVFNSLLVDAASEKALIYINKINLFEVYYDVIKNYDEKSAAKFLASFKELPVEIIATISDATLEMAAQLKTKYAISVADSFALATAVLLDGSLVTSDHHEFDMIEKSGEVKFHWIR